MKREANHKKPAVRINFTCMQTNIHELPSMVDFAADHGAESLHVRHLLAYGDTPDSYKEEMAYRELFNAKSDQTRRMAARRGIELFMPDPVPEGKLSPKSCMTDGSRILRRVEAN